MQAGGYLAVLVTVADPGEAERLAQALVEEALAACVQILPGKAIYRWEGKLFSDPMTQLIIKTRAGRWTELRDRVQALHGDEVPEILALPVVEGLPAYLAWLEESVSG